MRSRVPSTSSAHDSKRLRAGAVHDVALHGRHRARGRIALARPADVDVGLVVRGAGQHRLAAAAAAQRAPNEQVALRQAPAAARRVLPAALAVGLRGIPRRSIDDRLVRALEPLAEVREVAEDVPGGQQTLGHRGRPPSAAAGSDAVGVELAGDARVGADPFDVVGVDPADNVRLGGLGDPPPGLALRVAVGGLAPRLAGPGARPDARACALASEVALELGNRRQHGAQQSAHGGRCVDLLAQGHEGDALAVEHVVHLEQVPRGTAEAVEA